MKKGVGIQSRRQSIYVSCSDEGSYTFWKERKLCPLYVRPFDNLAKVHNVFDVSTFIK